MGTHARIGLMTKHAYKIKDCDFKVESIHCHYDGGSHTAKILLEKYSTATQVKHLLNLGDIAHLYEDFFETKVKTYNRKNDQNLNLYHYSVKDFLQSTEASQAEFLYLFNPYSLKGNQWFWNKGKGCCPLYLLKKEDF